MSTRRPTQPRSPRSPNTAGAPHNFVQQTGTHVHPMQDDMQVPEDTVSLTSLENDAADDFEKLMIQTARDQRRLKAARLGKVQAFRKARTHPRVGVTLENLERHNASGQALRGANAHVTFDSPPSSGGSTRSDPALQPPTGWGRKARVKRNWMRTITAEEEQTSGAHEDAVNGDAQTPRRVENPDKPRQSVEDSPLSHKSSLHGTPVSTRQRNTDDWDFDMNEASLIASTPYLPRNTALDDIRQREMESLKEQGVTTSRLGKSRDGSLEDMRRPPSASATSTAGQPNGTAQEQADSMEGSPELQLRKRTSSWQTIGKSPAVTAEGLENSPIVVYKKSSETVSMVDSRLLASAQANPTRPAHRREDSHDLLRRLARASSTPSPGRAETSRPQTAPASQVGSSSHTVVTGTSPPAPVERPASSMGVAKRPVAIESAVPGTPQAHNSENTKVQAMADSASERQTKDTSATPKSSERSLLNPKTPVVTGAWVDTMIDTPHSSTIQRPQDDPQPSTPPQKRSPKKKSAQESQTAPSVEEQEPAVAKASRPNLPRSALEAIVEEARSAERQQPADYGESTINSLEDLIAPIADSSESGEPDEDTLLGLQMPTGVPRNEAERQRQQELLHLHRMNERLHAARTSIRDASRGIRRVENRVEHGGEGAQDGERVRIVYQECPCVVNGAHQWSLWKAFQSLFYDERLKPRRRGWGLTLLSIALISFFAWLVLENIACEIWGHYEYASSYKGYGVVWGAPEFPYVMPTMLYRAFIKPWWRPLWAFLVWTWKALGVEAEDATTGSARSTGSRLVEKLLVSQQARTAFEEDGATVLGMAADEVV